MRTDDSATRFEMVPFFHGRILDVSEGTVKTFPHFMWYLDVRVEDPFKLDMFADRSLDGVVSSNLLHLMPMEDVRRTLAEWSRVVRDGGHIVLHLPAGGEKWDVSPETVIEAMAKLTNRGWDLVDNRALDSGLLFAFKMQREGRDLSFGLPKPEKTCAVVRLGAFGDNVQASSIFPWLKEQGYHITFYTSDHGYPVVKHDPHIDRFIVQGADEVPPQALGAFWEHEKKKYSRWINLSESVEGSLLAPPGSAAHGWPNEVRAKYMDRNYLEFTHEIAGVPPPYQPRFYSTADEREQARFEKRKFGRKNILWSLSGSSVHKTWPHMDAVIAAVLLQYRDVHFILVGDEMSKMLETGWCKWDESKNDFIDASERVHCKSGRWSIRQSMAFAEVADLIIGTETGLLNAAGCMETPKIVTLSHSSPEMLTKHWVNTTVLTQGANGCAKFPCRQLHHSFEHCNRHESGDAAVCQYNISAATMMDAVMRVLGEPNRMAA